jgi:hypothetical protein
MKVAWGHLYESLVIFQKMSSNHTVTNNNACIMFKQKPNLFYLLAVPLFLAVLYTSCTKTVSSVKDKYSIITNIDSLSFSDTGGKKTFTITANAPMAVYLNSGTDWVSYSPKDTVTAANNYAITVTVPAYDQDNGKRTTQLTIRSGNLATDEVVRKFITITQTGPVTGPRAPGIYTLKDLSALAVAVAANQDLSSWQDANGVIHLMKDIDAGAALLPCIGGQTVSSDTVGAFGGIFDGNGHTIKGTLDGSGKPIVALFTRLAPSGLIKNLTVDVNAVNDYSNTDVQPHLAALVGFSVTATTGGIENCVSKGTLTRTGSATNPRVGGIVAFGRCNITGCTNYAVITSSSNRVGGINGAGGGTFTIRDCNNYGNINVDCSAAQVGGIIGQLNGQTVVGCTNYGNLKATANGNTVIGGIAGNSQGTSSIGSAGSPCVNNGKITLIASSAAPGTTCGAGGISGGESGAVPFVNCKNSTDVASQVDNASIAVGGIVGTMSTATTFTNCINDASSNITSAQNAGGIIGLTTKAMTLTACSNAGNIKWLGATVPAKFIGGIIGSDKASTLTSCIYGGTVLGAAGTSSNAIGN